MPEFFKLRNQIKHYDWGSPEWIPRLLGAANEAASPWAELWMGSHPGAASLVVTGRGEMSLGELIAGDPVYCLGKQGAERYGELPFLFKLLAAERPLSIQAHPNSAQAREGFERENRAGLAPDAPGRNYRDPNQKIEIICAITPFTGMCGFREPAEIRRLFAAFLAPRLNAPPLLRESFAPLFAALEAGNAASALREMLSALFALPGPARDALTAYMLDAAAAALDADTGLAPELWGLMRRCAELYPGDPALVAPLYLNVFNLRAGEAVFLRPGLPHAYVYGFGVELMTNSDNVLRGGLTRKYVDLPELLNVLDCSPFAPVVLRPPPGGLSFTYPAPCDEFALSVYHGSGGDAVPAAQGPAICVVIEGEATLCGEHERLTLKQGESVFIPAGADGAKPPAFRGNYRLYAASLPARP